MQPNTGPEAPRTSVPEIKPAAPDIGVAEAMAVPAEPEPPRPLPLLSIALIVVLFIAMAIEMTFGFEGARWSVTPRTLLAFGGLQKIMVVNYDQWWRMITAALLHIDPVHLILNSAALYIAGRVLEPLIGRAWMGALLVIGAVTGALASLTFNEPGIVSVGASGAVIALFAAMYVLSFRLPDNDYRKEVRKNAVWIIILSFLPFAASASGAKVDIGAHFGGAVGGVLVAFVVLAFWRDASSMPRFRAVALAICATGILVAAGSAVPLAKHFREYELAGQLIPAAELPSTTAERKAQSAKLLERYPHDPRAHLFRALALIDARDPAGAEKAARAALDKKEMLERMLDPAVGAQIRFILAAALIDRGQLAEAKQIASPVCASSAPDLADMKKILTGFKACD
jgi:rhomboid protease GluP